MNIPEFIRKLRETPRDWVLHLDKSIRRDSGIGCRCPILEIGNGPWGSNCQYLEYGMRLGLSAEDVGIIVDAADGVYSGSPSEIGKTRRVRIAMLRACGLTEPKNA